MSPPGTTYGVGTRVETGTTIVGSGGAGLDEAAFEAPAMRPESRGHTAMFGSLACHAAALWPWWCVRLSNPQGGGSRHPQVLRPAPAGVGGGAPGVHLPDPAGGTVVRNRVHR